MATDVLVPTGVDVAGTSNWASSPIRTKENYYQNVDETMTLRSAADYLLSLTDGAVLRFPLPPIPNASGRTITGVTVGWYYNGEDGDQTVSQKLVVELGGVDLFAEVEYDADTNMVDTTAQHVVDSGDFLITPMTDTIFNTYANAGTAIIQYTLLGDGAGGGMPPIFVDPT